MDIYPRAEYGSLDRYLPDHSPIAFDLSDNRNLWGAHPAALEALASAGSRTASEYPESYAERFAASAAARFGVDAREVTTGAGGTGMLDAIMRAVAPTEMRYLDPGWPPASMLAVANGHRPVPVEWSEGIDDPVRFAGGGPCIVFLANPANPTGETVTDDWIRALLAHTERVGSVLIIDEAYGEYSRDADDTTPIAMALGSERALCVKTLSKAYGLAGLRIGYALASEALALEVDKARGPFMVSGTSTAAAAAAIASDSPWLAETVARSRANRERVGRSLRARGYDVAQSAANFVFVRVPDADLDEVARRLERSGVRARPFRSRSPAGTGLRATVGPWEAMQRLLDAFDLAAADRSSRPQDERLRGG
ncbi:MAG: histidinol-phosphate transaminase [Gemmatimonadetes bacterium]|nr:histidinol-phosphate transaminase [Gemmatimonadota bacterium]MCY3942269.1 histidinol-phosphate transaminase [Gemmatimonadota bacterium]